MNILQKQIPLDCNIFNYGDDHEGSDLRHSDGWGQLVDMINSPYDGVKTNLAVDHGDHIEAICIDDYRYDGLTTQGAVLAQQYQAVRNRQAIKKNLITVLDGNHPRKHWKFGRLTEDLCKQLNVPYGDWSAHITYTDKKGNSLFRQFAAHGFIKRSMSSSTDDPRDNANSLLRSLRRMLQKKAGDCALMSIGHYHKLLVYKPVPALYLTADEKIRQHYTVADQTAQYIEPTNRYYICCGSFLKGFKEGVSGYAEIAGYDPIQLGFTVAKVRGGQLVDIDEIRI